MLGTVNCMEMEDLIKKFEAGILPREAWTHAAHLRVALWYNHQSDYAAACQHVREKIIRFNTVVGIINSGESGYHETLTRFWMVLARQFLALHPGKSLNEVIELWEQSASSGKEYPLHYYSRERLFSALARQQWLEPDSRPLEAKWQEMAWMDERPVHHLQLSDVRFGEAFRTCTLDPVLFTHEAHLRLAWIYIRQYGLEEGMDKIRRHLQHFVAMVDEEDKYHETLTVAAIHIVHHFMQRYPVPYFEAFMQVAPVLQQDFRGLVARHYHAQILASETARKQFIKPDLRPFDTLSG